MAGTVSAGSVFGAILQIVVTVFQSPHGGDGECGPGCRPIGWRGLWHCFSPLMAGTVSAGISTRSPALRIAGFSPLMAGTVSAGVGGGRPDGETAGAFQSPHGGDGECGRTDTAGPQDARPGFQSPHGGDGECGVRVL